MRLPRRARQQAVACKEMLVNYATSSSQQDDESVKISARECDASDSQPCDIDDTLLPEVSTDLTGIGVIAEDVCPKGAPSMSSMSTPEMPIYLNSDASDDSYSFQDYASCSKGSP